MTVWWTTLHTRQSSIQNNKYQVSHKHSCFSWWWTRSRTKHVEQRNKHNKKNCETSWLYLQDLNINPKTYCPHNTSSWSVSILNQMPSLNIIPYRFFKSNSYLRLDIPNYFLPLGLLTPLCTHFSSLHLVPYEPTTSPPTHLILLDFMHRIIFYEHYSTWSSYL